jgi:hypothetical protein
MLEAKQKENRFIQKENDATPNYHKSRSIAIPFLLFPVHGIHGIVRGHNEHTLLSLSSQLAAISLEKNHAEARKEAEDKEGNSLPVAAGVARAESSGSAL